MGSLGRMLILGGLAIAALGVVFVIGERFGLGKLPGDLVWKRKNTSVYFPIVSSLVVSVIATIVLNLILRRK